MPVTVTEEMRREYRQNNERIMQLARRKHEHLKRLMGEDPLNIAALGFVPDLSDMRAFEGESLARWRGEFSARHGEDYRTLLEKLARTAVLEKLMQPAPPHETLSPLQPLMEGFLFRAEPLDRDGPEWSYLESYTCRSLNLSHVRSYVALTIRDDEKNYFTCFCPRALRVPPRMHGHVVSMGEYGDIQLCDLCLVLSGLLLASWYNRLLKAQSDADWQTNPIAVEMARRAPEHTPLTLRHLTLGRGSRWHDTLPMDYVLPPFALACRMQHDLDLMSDSAGRAHSYETKKNIPNRVFDRMILSPLNRRFGYIEIDENCDLTQLTEAETALERLLYGPFKGVDLSAAALRFRRLGQYSTDGMYFPYFNCICLDIGSMGSFVHEFGLMLDYQNDAQSLQTGFAPLLALYTRHLQNAMNASEEVAALLKKRHKGRSWLDYYRAPTEVFARCLELYLAAVLHLRSPLMLPPEPPALRPAVYPAAPALLAAVKEYFDNAPFLR